MGFDKLTVPLLGKPLILHTLTSFDACAEIDDILLVVASSRVAEFEEITASAKIGKLRGIIQGGPERDSSVWNGLRSLPKGTDYVAVHDAARPLVSADLIARCVQAAKISGAAACAEPLTDTLQRCDAQLKIIETVPRKDVWRMQTPQAFKTEILVDCYTQVLRDGKYVTDESSALMLCGQSVQILPSEEWNFKVTFPRDVKLMESILRASNEMP